MQNNGLNLLENHRHNQQKNRTEAHHGKGIITLQDKDNEKDLTEQDLHHLSHLLLIRVGLSLAQTTTTARGHTKVIKDFEFSGLRFVRPRQNVIQKCYPQRREEFESGNRRNVGGKCGGLNESRRLRWGKGAKRMACSREKKFHLGKLHQWRVSPKTILWRD